MTANEIFDKYWRSLSLDGRRLLLRQLFMECGANRDKVYSWRSGRTALKNEDLDKITDIIGEDIFTSSLTESN